LGTPPLKNSIDAQGFFGLIVPLDATAAKRRVDESVEVLR